MAIKLYERYPGRADPASLDYPQGSFKNRTSPTAKDGTYLEKDWANDQQGFFQSVLSYFGVTPSGSVDKVGDSQYFNALTSSPTELRKGMPLIASQTEANAGTDDSKVITAKKMRSGFAMVTGLNGYIAFPTWLGGFIIQWTGAAAGQNGGVVRTNFPTTFPTSCYGVLAIHQGADASVNIIVDANNPVSNSSFGLRSNFSGNNPSCYVIAWGK